MSIITKHETLAGRMQSARLFAGLDQAAIAAEVGRARENISKYENGHTEVPSSVLIRWAEVTGASLNWLAWGEESRPRESNPRPSHYKRETPMPAEVAMVLAYLIVRRAVTQ